MKKILFLAIILFFTAHNTFAQAQKYDWKKMKPEERKQIIQNMTPQQRMSTLQQFRENMMMTELDLPKNTQEEFKKLYTEYQAKQNDIKSKFKTSDDYETMSDEEATRQLDKSFEIGQELLDNRKIYCKEFMKVIKPQQVLQMYQTEGKMRKKILDKKDGQGNPSSQRRRP